MTQTERVEKIETILIDTLGKDLLFDNLIKALSYNIKEDTYNYIARMFDIDLGDLND